MRWAICENHSEIVRDEEHGQRKLFAQVVEQVKHLRLDGDVERRQQAKDRQCRNGFSRARLSYQPQDFARINMKADVTNGGKNSLGSGKFYG